ncbi:hypothetical protein IV203_032762 [Nitzschia inconspicua]|uniref:DUF6824 domain-containing protein n=1 Tax=Nitzschia inconspicua TaxID=303405 RepID=A0A9K3KKX2_9STRA|nr:hypothetical protein IV203_032762 [Nitzschia inconspicua]
MKPPKEEIYAEGTIHLGTMGEVEKIKTIYLGKGRDLQEHSGNIYFRSFVEAFTEQYEIASKRDKKHVITGVIRLLEIDGYRFLKYTKDGEGGTPKIMDDGSWIYAGEDEIYSKVGHVFRSCRKSRLKPGGRSDEATERARMHKTAIFEALQLREKEKMITKAKFREQRLNPETASPTNKGNAKPMWPTDYLQSQQNFGSRPL